MEQAIPGHSEGEPPPRWWWWARLLVAVGAVAAPLAAMTESMSFAMSYPYARIIAILAPHECPHDVSVWRELPGGAWADNAEGFLESVGGPAEVTPWLWLTDWLWLIPIAASAAVVNTALFPSWGRREHFRLVSVGSGVGALVYGVYLLAFVYGTEYPVAIAQRDIGIWYAGPTLVIGAVMIVAAQPIARGLLRRLVSATRQRAAHELFIGLYRSEAR